MHLKRFLAIASLLLSGCSALPKVPAGELCSLSPSTKSAGCVPFGSRDIPDYNDQTLGIDTMENYICFSPTDWEGIETYLRQMRSKAEQCQ